MTELVLREDGDGVSTLTLNRPDALNALNPALFIELRGHVESIRDDTDGVGCVVLRGAGRSFCAGNDLKSIREGQEPPAPTYQADTIDMLEALPQPVIAEVRGHCYTGGLELALGCDLLVASDTAKFADTHGKWGMTPRWGMSQRLPRRVGYLKAKEMSYTARVYSGAEAAAFGLANQCVADDQLEGVQLWAPVPILPWAFAGHCTISTSRWCRQYINFQCCFYYHFVKYFVRILLLHTWTAIL